MENIIIILIKHLETIPMPISDVSTVLVGVKFNLIIFPIGRNTIRRKVNFNDINNNSNDYQTISVNELLGLWIGIEQQTDQYYSRVVGIRIIDYEYINNTELINLQIINTLIQSVISLNSLVNINVVQWI